MSAAGKAKAKASASASGGKRGAPPKDPADAPLPSDKRRRERGGMDDSDHEFDRCLAPLLPPSASLLFFSLWGFGAARARGSFESESRGDEARGFRDSASGLDANFAPSLLVFPLVLGEGGFRVSNNNN
jgi:hypothetical protein